MRLLGLLAHLGTGSVDAVSVDANGIGSRLEHKLDIVRTEVRESLAQPRAQLWPGQSVGRIGKRRQLKVHLTGHDEVRARFTRGAVRTRDSDSWHREVSPCRVNHALPPPCHHHRGGEAEGGTMSESDEHLCPVHQVPMVPSGNFEPGTIRPREEGRSFAYPILECPEPGCSETWSGAGSS